MQELLKMEHIDKRFFGIHALKDVDFTVNVGEVIGLIGENGAGKSTLMKILGGIYKADGGEITFNGKKITVRSPIDAQNIGISFIHQELSLFPDLDIATNIFVQNIPNRLGMVNNKDLKKRTKEILKLVGLEKFSPDKKLRSLQIGERQLVEIARCLAMDTKLLVLDEPTSSLTSNEVKILFDLIRRMKADGVSVIFISHRLDELFEITDRITVLRDGKMIDTVKSDQVTQKDLIHMMIGREINEMFDPQGNNVGKELLRVDDLCHAKRFRDVSFNVRAGEIVGLYGLLGSGRSEIARSIFGLEKFKSGKIYIDGKESHLSNPTAAIRAGIGFVSEDRRLEGLVINHSVKSNLSIVNLKCVSEALNFISRKKEVQMCQKNVDDLKIATDRLTKAVKYLSGGNQQKVVIAKWLNINPKILILDEPTRGVDVGAKKEIYSILNNLMRQGIAVLVISSELNEVMGLCDRVLVLRKGEIVDRIEKVDFTKERLLSASMGGA